jgi:hypothetical protein
MVAIAIPGTSAEQRERSFFLAMAVFVSAVIASGFLIRIVNGTTTFERPWWVHVHAVSFMAWLALYVLQSLLVVRGSIGQHRALGRAGIVLALWMTAAGVAITAKTVALARAPPFFTPAYFLALDWLNALFFLGLVGWAVHLRRQSDWHRRLMLCATVCVGIPGFARLIILTVPPPDVLKQLLAAALFLTPALTFDLVTRRRIHPAYVGGIGALLLMGLLVEPISRLAPLAAFAEWLTH